MDSNATRTIHQNSYHMAQRNDAAVRPYAEKPQLMIFGRIAAVLCMSAMRYSNFPDHCTRLLVFVNFQSKHWISVSNSRFFNVNLVDFIPEICDNLTATRFYAFFVSRFVEQLYNAIIKFVALAKAFLLVAHKNKSAGATFVLNHDESLRWWNTLTTLITSLLLRSKLMTTPIVHSPLDSTKKIDLTLRQESDGDIFAALQPFLDRGMSLPYALKALVRAGMAQAEIAKMAIRSANRERDIEAFNASVDAYNAEIEGHNDAVDEWFSDSAEDDS